MKLVEWKIEFRKDWNKYFKKFDSNTQKKIFKKLKKMAETMKPRGLHRSRFCVEEVNQYRIVYTYDDKTNMKSIYFIGNYKQYEKWFRSLEQNTIS